ncbi:MAG: hypothetical protein GXP24_02895 [Planctomycetes bacterium]|nr:hypothetical protein [Planctomycetota bacterium]
MGLSTLFNRHRARRHSTQRLQPAPLAPQRLERRRVLDAGAAELLLGSLGDAGEYVQAGENFAGQGFAGQGLTGQGDDSGEEANQAPSNVLLFLDSNSFFENDVLQLGVVFQDADVEDTHIATIDWGDGTPIETVSIDPGARFFTLSHQYLDDNPTSTPSDINTIKVSIFDAAGQSASATTRVTVKNVAPTNLVLVPTRATIFENQTAELALLFRDVGTLDTHTVQVDWGDGSAIEQFEGVSPASPLLLSHQYLDDDPTATLSDVYQVKVTVIDDDGGQKTATTPVHVLNVSPIVFVADDLEVDEGALFDLSDGSLVSFTDVGTLDTFSATIDWGDGTPIESVAASQSNGLGTLDAIHRYADDGLYSVEIMLRDDDHGLVIRKFQVQVNNVAPTLTLTDRELEINEGDTLDLFDLGTFSDPGFDNPLNFGNSSNGGEVTETFSYTIDWGDGTIETGQLPATVVSGSAGVDTLGTLVGSNLYLDNDSDNLYTITVTLSDDDGGSVTEQIIVRVLNVNPTLEPITATDVNTKGETTLTLEFADPGTEVLTVWVDWGDKLALPPDQRFVPETFVLGPGSQNLTLQHVYSGPPDPLHPAADIVLSVFIRDDDFGDPVVDVGQSETQNVAISNPGIGTTPIVIDTTPQVPRLVFPQQDEGVFFVGATSSDEGGVQTADLRTAVGDTKSTTDRYLELRVIDPTTGEQSEGYRLKPEVLNDLPGLFRTLPDNRYAIYLVRTETNTHRLVIEVYVRNGKLIDPGDDSEGTRDRPPTDEAIEKSTEAPKLEAPPAPLLNPPQLETPSTIPANDSANVDQQMQVFLGTTLVGLAASRSGLSWAERIDRAVASADSRMWQRLRERLRGRRPGNRNSPNN